VSFPDPTALLITYLTPLLDPAAVVSRVPDPRPTQLVQVRRTGGNALEPVRDSARMDVWAWAATDQAAMTLGLTVRSAVWALAGTTLLGGVPCYRVQEFMAPRLDEDPTTNSPRCWATYTLDLRANAVISPAPPA
jgi:hypothetical protein